MQKKKERVWKKESHEGVRKEKLAATDLLDQRRKIICTAMPAKFRSSIG
jgi:hypothetical protein